MTVPNDSIGALSYYFALILLVTSQVKLKMCGRYHFLVNLRGWNPEMQAVLAAAVDKRKETV
jgi:hypothetical protein